MTSSEQLIHYLVIQTGVITRLLPIVSQHLNQEDIHKLRVGIRRARTVLWLLKNSSAKIFVKGLDTELRKVAKSLGTVRDLDVAILAAKNFGVEYECLLKERKAHQKKLRGLITLKRRKRLEKQLTLALKTAKAETPIVLRKARQKLKLRLNKELSQNLENQKSLHHIRLSLKKARYALEAMAKSVDPLKRVQTLLGSAHDLERLQTLTKKNRRIESEWSELNDKAIPLVKPAIRFALRQF